jgi:hypothetical protein
MIKQDNVFYYFDDFKIEKEHLYLRFAKIGRHCNPPLAKNTVSRLFHDPERNNPDNITNISNTIKRLFSGLVIPSNGDVKVKETDFNIPKKKIK